MVFMDNQQLKTIKSTHAQYHALTPKEKLNTENLHSHMRQLSLATEVDYPDQELNSH